jgi:hypothetical protein
MDRLPRLPSELIRLALADLAKCEAQPERFVIDMGRWHLPTMSAAMGSMRCYVCLAGSVLAQTLGIADDVALDCIDEVEDEHIRLRLLALNEFRVGDVGAGLHYFGLAAPSELTWPVNFHYADDPVLFRRQMNGLADDLERHGL